MCNEGIQQSTVILIILTNYLRYITQYTAKNRSCHCCTEWKSNHRDVILKKKLYHMYLRNIMTPFVSAPKAPMVSS